MILARLAITESPSGQRYLEGKTTCNWTITPGIKVVLKKEKDGTYALCELGPRPANRGEQAILSFVDPDEDRTCHEGKR